jgi:hypothetical protein
MPRAHHQHDEARQHDVGEMVAGLFDLSLVGVAWPVVPVLARAVMIEPLCADLWTLSLC